MAFLEYPIGYVPGRERHSASNRRPKVAQPSELYYSRGSQPALKIAFNTWENISTAWILYPFRSSGYISSLIREETGLHLHLMLLASSPADVTRKALAVLICIGSSSSKHSQGFPQKAFNAWEGGGLV